MPQVQDLLRRNRNELVQWFVQLFVILACAGTAVPGVNESHYLTKAKHALDSSFAPADLFLESGDSHLAATYLAGLLALILPLEAVAWLGRFLAWGFLSWSWMRLCRVLRVPGLLAPFALATWIFAVHYGNWAGEWAVGGFEGKSIAYPCVLLGIAAALDNRWQHGWIWLAIAIVWHPLVGGWAGLSVGLVWLFTRNSPSFFNQWPWIAAAFFISLLGVFPALGGIRGDDPNGIAAQVHVYFRLDHHLRPTTFSEQRNWAAAGTMALFLTANIGWLATFLARHRTLNHAGRNQERIAGSKPPASGQPADAIASPKPHVQPETEFATWGLEQSGRLLCIAWFAGLFALMGWIIDSQIGVSSTTTHQPILASKLLRFYWLRWADAALPLAWTLVLWQGLGYRHSSSPSQEPGASESGILLRRARIVGQVFTIVLVVGLTGYRLWESWDDNIPPADRLVVETMGERRLIEWPNGGSNRYIDWLAVCDWIRQNTPEDSLWLTPKYQQTFKWYAQRAEVVCWKDVPQDNASVIEWYRRVKILQPRRTPSGLIRGWTDEELKQLHEEFAFNYVLVDRTYYAAHEPPPRLELVYPVEVTNRSFAVFRMR